MATSETYRSYQISWRETGEQYVALVRLLRTPERPTVITATVGEGMSALKERTYRLIDEEIAERGID